MASWNEGRLCIESTRTVVKMMNDEVREHIGTGWRDWRGPDSRGMGLCREGPRRVRHSAGRLSTEMQSFWLKEVGRRWTSDLRYLRGSTQWWPGIVGIDMGSDTYDSLLGCLRDGGIIYWESIGERTYSMGKIICFWVRTKWLWENSAGIQKVWNWEEMWTVNINVEHLSYGWVTREDRSMVFQDNV